MIRCSVEKVRFTVGYKCYRLSNFLAIKQIPLSRVVGTITVPQLVNEFPAFCGTRKSITIFTKARHFSLSLARSIQSTSSHPNPLRCILISHVHLRQGLPNDLSFSFHHQNPTCIYFLPLRAKCPPHLVLPDFVTRMIFTRE